MVGLQHGLNGHELEQTPRDSEGQGSLVCCSPWGSRVGHDLATKQQQMLGQFGTDKDSRLGNEMRKDVQQHPSLRYRPNTQLSN